jgi:hypothetical protein
VILPKGLIELEQSPKKPRIALHISPHGYCCGTWILEFIKMLSPCLEFASDHSRCEWLREKGGFPQRTDVAALFHLPFLERPVIQQNSVSSHERRSSLLSHHHLSPPIPLRNCISPRQGFGTNLVQNHQSNASSQVRSYSVLYFQLPFGRGAHSL